MRMPEQDEDLTGKVCICSAGRIAVVAGKRTIEVAGGKELDMWFGMGFDGKGTWASSNPAVAFESLTEYHDILVERLNGKLSFLG